MGITMPRVTIGATIALTVWSGPTSVQTASTVIMPFSEFVNSLSIAPADAYVGRSGAAVKSTAAFEEMRQHLVSMYSGVAVEHSFIQGNQVFDCVPIHDQPGMRMQPSKTVPEPPPSPPGGVFRQGQNSDSPQVHETQGALGEPDPLGNAQQCEEGTIPMRRLTLDELTRFETLHDPNRAVGVTGSMPEERRASSPVIFAACPEVGVEPRPYGAAVPVVLTTPSLGK